ncbi:helix-turn-helix domain-containing protein [Streptomyces sp. NPDC001903]|uniref:helix-turn-helix domain-containing protein n=1 Tax=Streptomyces sp. NPDC001903 TaxID=3364622 RepID=UPI0036A4770E
MGRRELPVDYTVRARGELAAALRQLRAQSGLTYDELAARTGLSAATLKRASSGRTVPSWTTLTAACGGEPRGGIVELWRSARAADRGRLKGLRRPPAPELITTAGQLSEALEYFYEKAGAPSLRQLQARAGGAHLMPVSSAARIVARQALPASRQQCVAFLTALDVVPGVVRRLADTYDRVTANPADSWRGLSDLEVGRVLAAGASDTTDHRLGAALRLADLRHIPGASRRAEEVLRQLAAESMRVGRDGPRESHSRAA